MEYTLTGWKNTASTALVGSLPLMSADIASVLVDSYLSSIGGWVPNDEGNPTGVGQPANGQTPSEAAASITESEYNRIYSSEIEATVKLKMVTVDHFTENLSEEDTLALLENKIPDIIDEQLSSTSLELVSVEEYIGDVVAGGETNTALRVEINGKIGTEDERLDPSVIALSKARSAYELDNLWNVQSYYTREEENSIVYIIRKYQTLSYSALDTNNTDKYVIKLNGTTYTLISGLIKK